MSKEEFEKLKAELKEEILADMKKKPKKKKLWKEFVNEFKIELDKKGYSSGKFFNEMSFFIRNVLGISNVQNITEEQMEKIRPLLIQIIDCLQQRKPIVRDENGYIVNVREVIV